MQIGLHSHSRRHAFANQPGYDIHQFFAEAADWGFEAVEVMTGKAGEDPAETHIGTDDAEQLKTRCAEAREQGVPVVCWSTYNDFSFTPNEEWRRANVAYIEHWIELAATTSVPNLRFLTGYLPKEEDEAAMEDLVARETQRVAQKAEAAGVNLALENHSRIFLFAEDILRLMKQVDSPALTTCPDPSNGFAVLKNPQDAAEQQRMLANLEHLAPHATNAHVKVLDAQFTGIDIRRVVEILHAHNFTGALHLELVPVEADPVVLKEACRVLKTVRDDVLQTKGAAHG